MNRIKNNLMVKMTLMTCTLVLVVVAAIGGISYYWSSQAVTTEVEAKLRAELHGVKAEFALRLDSTEAMLDLVGTTPTIKSLGTSDFRTKSAALKNTRLLLEDMKKMKSELLESIFITDLNGRVQADSTGGTLVGLDLSSRDYISAAKAGDHVWSDILESKSTGRPVRVYAYPIKNASGQTTGILAAAVQMDALFEVLSELKIGENGYAYMVDQTGLFVYHPNETIMMKKTVADLNVEALTNAVPSMTAGKDGQLIYTLSGVTKLNIYTGLDHYSISLNADQAEYLASLHHMRSQMLMFGVIFFVLGMIVAGSIAYYIVSRIRRMQAVMKAAADGDLTAEFLIKGIIPLDGDEVAQMGISLNNMIEGFRDMIIQIIRTSESLSSSSQELAASAEEGGQAAEEVTANIEEITAGSEEQSSHVLSTQGVVLEMKSELDKSSEATKQMVDESMKVMDTAKDGQQQMRKTVKQMDAIRVSSEQTIKVINSLNEQSTHIGSISETISDIADQTNLLALNASIEAARAGDQGRGFAVVAEEIRKLATESQESATGINDLISQIQSEITMASALINAENAAIHEGITTIDKTGESFDDISSRIQATNILIEEVAVAIESTENYGSKVTESMEFIATVSQQSTASSEAVSASAEEQNAVSQEIASASDQLSSMAQDLLQRVTKFRV